MRQESRRSRPSRLLCGLALSLVLLGAACGAQSANPAGGGGARTGSNAAGPGDSRGSLGGADAASDTDGGTGEPAAPDAAPDTGRDATASPCTTGGAELCDDFESGKLDTGRWKLNKPTASASIAIDGVHAHSGTHAVHIQVVPDQQSTAMITEVVTFPAPSNSFYARMFVYFGPDIPVRGGADFHTGFMFGIGKNDRGPVQAGLGMIGGARQWLGYSIFFGNPKLEFGPWSKAVIEANRWICVELFEDGSDPNTEIRKVWVDAQELAELRSDSAKSANGQVNHRPPAFDGVSFGLWEYHPIPTLADMWIDDIRVSAQHIGCAR